MTYSKVARQQLLGSSNPTFAENAKVGHPWFVLVPAKCRFLPPVGMTNGGEVEMTMVRGGARLHPTGRPHFSQRAREMGHPAFYGRIQSSLRDSFGFDAVPSLKRRAIGDAPPEL